MQLLVTTPRYLLLVDLNTRQVRPVESHRWEYYGISWRPGGQDLYLSHSGLDNESLVDITTYALSETGWLSYGKCETGKFLSQPHQIVCAPDGRVVCSNTGRNCVTVVDVKKPGCFHEARLSETRWDRIAPDQNTGDHLNSVFIKRRRLYVTAHRFNKGSCIAEFSYPDLTLLNIHSAGNRRGLHNVWVTDEGEMISCHSEIGALIDLVTNEVLWTSGLPIYIRGLAATKSVVVLGESGKTKRDSRGTSVSGLWVLDRQTWRALDYLCLGPYGAIHEIRILDEPDLAHNASPFAGLHTLTGQDAWATQRSRRLATERRMCEYRNLEVILGTPFVDEGGWLTAQHDDLCLALVRIPMSAGGIAFTYDLNGTQQGSHVSGVLAYRGERDDSRMLAVLLQCNGKSTVGALWLSDWGTWVPADQPPVVGLPNTGNARIIPSGEELILSVDEIQCGRFAVTERDLGGGVGVRWTNARIRNIHGLGPPFANQTGDAVAGFRR